MGFENKSCKFFMNPVGCVLASGGPQLRGPVSFGTGNR